jgi:hypothetical protein
MMSRTSRGGSNSAKSKALLPENEQRFFEDALAALPTTPTPGASAMAEDLGRYNHHQNPYLRAFARVLAAGYSLARRDVVDCYQRFKTAHRDAELAGVDRVTIEALAEAAAALEQAMAPDGSIGDALQELRSRTLQRLWSRVCETCQLPPPSFTRIFARRKEQPSIEEIEAAENAAIAALMIAPVATSGATDDDADALEAADDDEEGDDDDASDDDDSDDDDGDGDGDEDGDDGDDGDGDDGNGGGFSARVERSGNAEQLAELLLAAGSDLLARARSGLAKDASFKLTLSLDAGGRGGNKGGGRKRRRRRRRRS